MEKKDYLKKYKQIYKGVPNNNKKKAAELVEKLSDVLVMMDECKEHLDSEGCVTEMSQGAYSIARENPWSRVYDSKAKLMVVLLDKLDKLLPDQKAESITTAGENLAKMIIGGKPVKEIR